MPDRTTLIVIALPTAPPPAREQALGSTPRDDLAMRQFDALHLTLVMALESGLNVLCIAQGEQAATARALMPEERVIDLHNLAARHMDGVAQAVSAAVMTTSQAPAWLLLPASPHAVRPDTLQRLTHAIAEHPIVFPQRGHSRGYPIGFSSEFYSELVRLTCERDLNRLINRYPGCGIEVDDPGLWLDTAHNETAWPGFTPPPSASAPGGTRRANGPSHKPQKPF